MFEVYKLGIALLGSAAAGLWDLKTTDIPDRLVIPMIILGIGIHAYESFLTSNFQPLMISLAASGAFLVFSLFMYRFGYWGGGDGELLVAIGALLPLYPGTTLPFSLSFFLNMFIVGAVYSMVYAFLYALRNRRLFEKSKQEIIKSKNTIAASFLITFIFLFAALSYLNAFSYLLYSIAAGFSVALILILYIFAHVVEKEGFYRKIPSSKLKEGDMIGEDIPKLGVSKKLIRGLTKEEVRKIRAAKKSVLIREGVRFGPVFPLALLFTLFYGNFLFF